MTSQESQDVRAEYRRRIQQRQTVLFGSIIAMLALLLLLGTLFWTQLLPFPFDREFSRSEEAKPQVPCPVSNAAPVDFDTLTVRVYNSTSTSGVAGQVSSDLAKHGVTVSETANWTSETLPDSVRIYAGENGVTSAYTLRSFFPDATIHFDSLNNSAVLDVVIGEAWTEMNAAPTEADIAEAMKPIPGCTANTAGSEVKE